MPPLGAGAGARPSQARRRPTTPRVRVPRRAARHRRHPTPRRPPTPWPARPRALPRRHRRRRPGRRPGGRCGDRLVAQALLLGLPLALLLAALGLQRLAHAHVLQPFRLDLLQPDDLGLGGLLTIEELLLGVLQLGLVVGDRLLVRLERRARLVEVVHGVGRGLVDDVDEHVGLQLLARQLVPGEQRDPGTAARHEAVHGNLLDLAVEGIDLLLQLSVLLAPARPPRRRAPPARTAPRSSRRPPRWHDRGRR